MGQLVEPGRGLSSNLVLLRPDELALPYCLPRNVLVNSIENATLHRSATFALSVGKDGRSVGQHRGNVGCPLMCEETAHVQSALAHQRDAEIR